MTYHNETQATPQPSGPRRPAHIRLAIIPPYLLQTIAWPFARLLLHFFARMQVLGHEQLHRLPRRVIFAANHTSHLDPVVIRAAVPYLTHLEPMFYVARQHKEYGWRGWRQLVFTDLFFRLWGAYPAYSGTGDYEKSLARIIELSSHDLPVCIFPGGFQHPTKREVRARGGVVHLAWATNALVVPVAISGTHASELRSFFSRKVRFKVTFGNPIDVRAHISSTNAPTTEEYERTAEIIAQEINTHWKATDPDWHQTEAPRDTVTTSKKRTTPGWYRVLRSCKQLCADFLRYYLPLPRGSDDVAFIVHPRDRADVYGKYPILKKCGDTWTDRITRHLWPVRVAPILGATKADGSPLRAWVLACPMTAQQMLHDRERAARTIRNTARLAYKRGATLVGLGALSASLSRGGLDISDTIPLSITTGRLFTVYNVSDLVLHGLEQLHIPHEKAHIAIVGAAGSIGAGVAQQLARHGVERYTLVDLSDKHEDITHVVNQVRTHNPRARVDTATSLNTLREADVVVTATNKPDALIRSEHVQPGTLLVDDAQPTDLAPEIFERIDLLVLEGGVVHAPHLRVPYTLGLKEEGDIFSCMAELLILAHEPMLKGSALGRSLTLDVEAIDALAQAAHAIGLTRAKLQNMHHLYTDDEIAYIRSCKVRSRE